MGAARTTSEDFPSGDADGAASLTTADGREWRFQHVDVGNPQCAIHLADRRRARRARPGRDRPRDRAPRAFPNRTNVSWYAELEPAPIRARIFERGVGETLSSGTGATGAAVAHVLRGGESPVTVVLDGGELKVEVGEDLHFNLTGWARPVYRGELVRRFATNWRTCATE